MSDLGPHGVYLGLPQRTYRVICISLYRRDLEDLDARVAELKRRGHTRANRSRLIRAALAQLDLERVPR